MFRKNYYKEYKKIKKELELVTKTNNQLEEDNDREIDILKDDNRREIRILKEDYERKLEFFVDKEVKTAKDAQLVAERKYELIKKENEIMKQITDINGDIIDVKSLVEKLIDKLPSINLNSLNIKTNE